jgi:hypothetical protein
MKCGQAFGGSKLAARLCERAICSHCIKMHTSSFVAMPAAVAEIQARSFQTDIRLINCNFVDDDGTNRVKAGNDCSIFRSQSLWHASCG